jgi:copper chaperone CopZ
MKKIFFILIGISVLGACSQSESAVEPVVINQKEEKLVVAPTKKLTLEIGGMSCEMGCGAAIRKKLFATGAVESVHFDFKMGRDLNTADILYDDTKISNEKITAIISSMNDKQFSVGKETVSDYEQKNNAVSVGSGNSKTSSSETSFTSIKPIQLKKNNLIDLLLSVLIRR